MARQLTLTFLLTGIICFSIACGNSGNGTSSSQQQAVSLALNPVPASTSIPVGNTTGIKFTAVASNDPNNSGIDWAITCPLSSSSVVGACGVLNTTNFHSASGTGVNYIPPATLPGGSLTVNVTAFATADHTKNVTTAVTVTSYVSVLNGTYVLQVLGSSPNNNSGTFQPYQSTGAFVFDGKGNITSGQQTLNTIAGASAVYTLQGSSGTPSTYFIGSDGRGTLTLNLQNAAAISLTETYGFVVLSSSKALIAELDASSPTSGVGTLELQDSTAATTMPTGAYAFVTSGSDSGAFFNQNGFNVLPTAIGGVLNIDNNPSPGGISGNGSLADQDYYHANGKAALLSCVPPTGVTGSVSKPSALGVVTIALTGATCFGLTPPGLIQFSGYIVDATHIRLVESDDVNGSAGFLTAGIAVSQGTAAGTFTNASLSGPYVLGVFGYDINDLGLCGVPGFSFTSAAVLTADGIGNLTGITDTFYPGAPCFNGYSGAYNATPLTGTYVMDANLIGRALLTPKFTGTPHPKPNVLLYETGNGTPPLVLWSEGEDVQFPAIGSGIAYPQAANAPTFSFGNPETYGVGFTQNNSNQLSGGEGDGSANMTSAINGVSGTLTGTLDDLSNNAIFGNSTISSPPLALLDTFALPADSFGRISGTFMNASGSLGPYVEYYLVNSNQGFLVETDLANSNASLPGVTLGYFAQACDVTSATSCQTAAQAGTEKPSSQKHNVRGGRNGAMQHD